MTARNPVSEPVKAEPTKTFFVDMLTRDISLEASIIDLLDNCVDGVLRTLQSRATKSKFERDYTGFEVMIEFNRRQFLITDNCGGIPIETAKNYAFCFGRPDSAPKPVAQSIGVYGIGMKRALLKMGNHFIVSPSTGIESFTIDVPVRKWRNENSWNFTMTNIVRSATKVPIGTVIEVDELHDGIARSFENPTFNIKLFMAIEREYAFILRRGLAITLNGQKVKSRIPSLLVGAGFAPIKVAESFDGVKVQITAGLAKALPEDISPGARIPEQESYGWYIVCNDRVIVTADRTSKTCWGRDGVPAWHPQYNGFIGIASFDAKDAERLPLATTKDDVESSSPIFQQALTTMFEATREFVNYTNKRSANTQQYRMVEKEARPVPVWNVSASRVLRTPTLSSVPTMAIHYDKPIKDIQAITRALKLGSKTAKAVGLATFDYVYKREVGK